MKFRRRRTSFFRELCLLFALGPLLTMVGCLSNNEEGNSSNQYHGIRENRSSGLMEAVPKTIFDKVNVRAKPILEFARTDDARLNRLFDKSVFKQSYQHNARYHGLEQDLEGHWRFWISTNRWEKGYFFDIYSFDSVSVAGRIIDVDGGYYDGGVAGRFAFYLDYENGIFLGLGKNWDSEYEFSRDNIESIFLLNSKLVPEYYILLEPNSSLGDYSGLYRVCYSWHSSSGSKKLFGCPIPEFDVHKEQILNKLSSYPINFDDIVSSVVEFDRICDSVNGCGFVDVEAFETADNVPFWYYF